MKKLHCFLFVLLASILLLCGCEGSTPGQEECDLAEPHPAIRNHVLTWNEVDHALEYSIEIEGYVYNAAQRKYAPEITIRTTENQLDLSMIVSPDERYEIKIKALGDNATYFDSEESRITYESKKTTQGLKYTLNPDGKEWVTLISEHYNLKEKEISELKQTIEESKTSIKINLSRSSITQRSAAIQFQRSFDDMDDETAKEILKIIARNKKSGL